MYAEFSPFVLSGHSGYKDVSHFARTRITNAFVFVRDGGGKFHSFSILYEFAIHADTTALRCVERYVSLSARSREEELFGAHNTRHNNEE